jgi:hypothetical protein
MTSKFRLMGTNTCVIFMGKWTGKKKLDFDYVTHTVMAVQVITFDMEMDTFHRFDLSKPILPDGTVLGISIESLTRPVGVLAIRLDGGQQTKMNNNNLHHIVGISESIQPHLFFLSVNTKVSSSLNKKHLNKIFPFCLVDTILSRMTITRTVSFKTIETGV